LSKIVFSPAMPVFKDYYPKPASDILPEWYKSMETYNGDGKVPHQDVKQTNGTIKRCMPIFDVLTAGYILFTWTDVFVTTKNNAPYFEWRIDNSLGFHSNRQIYNYPGFENEKDIAKFNQPWSIKTEAGFSSLFIAPVHRKSPFKIMEAVVDTDKYLSPVAFPFILNDDFRGLIPAGTPMAQVIPFKREKYTMSVENNLEEMENVKAGRAGKFFDAYKDLFRTIKEYK
jgi:hypothetical protein